MGMRCFDISQDVGAANQVFTLITWARTGSRHALLPDPHLYLRVIKVESAVSRREAARCAVRGGHLGALRLRTYLSPTVICVELNSELLRMWFLLGKKTKSKNQPRQVVRYQFT